MTKSDETHPMLYYIKGKESTPILPNCGIEKFASTKEEMDSTQAIWAMHISIANPLPPFRIQRKTSSPQQHHNYWTHYQDRIKKYHLG